MYFIDIYSTYTKMLFFNSLKWLFIFLIYLSLSMSSEPPVITKFIQHLCVVLQRPVPTTPSQFSALFNCIVLRFYPNRSIPKVKKEILDETGASSAFDDLAQWGIIFSDIENKFKHVEALLSAININRVPTNEVEWKPVTDFMNKLKEKIFDEKTKQSLETILTTATNYTESFKELALIYQKTFPNKGIGFAWELIDTLNLQWFDSLISNSSYATMIGELGNKFLKMVRICRLYECAFRIRQFIELARKDMINKIIADFETEEARRTSDLINYYKHLVKLTAKSSEVDTESTFKKQWNDVWTKKLSMAAKKPTDKEKAGDLEEAILRIWNADNAEEAFLLWKNDHSFWSEKSEQISTDDYSVIRKLTKPTRADLLSMKLSTKGVVRNEDKYFAITLHEYDLKDKEKYRQCVWILTYSKEDEIKRLKKKFNRIAPNTDFISQNHQFCQNLYKAWTITSIVTFHGKNKEELPPQCQPTEEDFETYISTLAADKENKEISDFLRIIQ